MKKTDKVVLISLLLCTIFTIPALAGDFDETGFINYLKDIHTGIYSVYDYYDDNEIYNCLAYSFAGDELDLQFYDFLKDIREFEEQGYRNIIKNVDYETIKIEKQSKKEIKVYMKWKVSALVKHTQHEHDRLAIYEAIYTLQPDEFGDFKIMGTQIINSERIMSPKRYYKDN